MARNEDKAKKKAQLQRLRRIATGLLVAMTIIYGVARSIEPHAPWVGFIRAFAEAAMIGAMADWFAVVALFRHPLGLPIPHTAILRRKQVEVGQGLGNFVVENFLTRDIVGRRLAKIDLTGVATEWLMENAETLADKVLSFLPRVLDAVDDADVARVVHRQVIDRLRAIPAAPALGRVLSILTADGKHEAVLAQVLEFGSSVVTENHAVIERGIEKELPIPHKVGPISLEGVRHLVATYISRKLVTNLQALLYDIGVKPDHHLRAEFGRRLASFIADLQNSPEHLARGEEIKNEMLENPALNEYAGSVWGQLKAAINHDLAEPDSQIRRHFVGLMKSVSGAVHDDAPLRSKLNDGLRVSVLNFVELNASDIGSLIEETVRSWNADDLIEKLELEVGRDLQFIRLNGTVIGGAIGLLIHTAEILIWR